MTDTTITTGPVQHEAGVLEHLDPAGLVVETNFRTEGLILDAEFVDSVRTHGVLVPVMGWRDTDGAVHVRAEQRRTLAAREAQVVSIPVYVVQAEDDGAAARMVEHLVENGHGQARSPWVCWLPPARPLRRWSDERRSLLTGRPRWSSSRAERTPCRAAGSGGEQPGRPQVARRASDAPTYAYPSQPHPVGWMGR